MRSACPGVSTRPSTAPRSNASSRLLARPAWRPACWPPARDAAERYLDDGFGFVAIGSDSGFIAAAARAAAARTPAS